MVPRLKVIPVNQNFHFRCVSLSQTLHVCKRSNPSDKHKSNFQVQDLNNKITSGA